MKFTINWLRDHLDFKHSLDDLVIKLNSIGLEVESYVNPFKDLNEFKIVEIIDYKKHPDADRLMYVMLLMEKKIFRLFAEQTMLKVD